MLPIWMRLWKKFILKIPKNAVVIGAVYRPEMAENLHARGMTVTIVERAPHVLPPLDEEMAAFVSSRTRRKRG